MLVCYVCGKTAEGGWVEGFPPAPDSQKLALCKEHDTEENREKVKNAWQNSLFAALETRRQIALQQANAAVYDVRVLYKSGGIATYSCYSCIPTAHGTLRLQAPSGAFTYLLLSDIKEYTVTRKPAF